MIIVYNTNSQDYSIETKIQNIKNAPNNLIYNLKKYQNSQDNNLDALIGFIDYYYDNIISLLSIYDYMTFKKHIFVTKFEIMFNDLLKDYKEKFQKEKNINNSKKLQTELINNYTQIFQEIIDSMIKNNNAFNSILHHSTINDFYSKNQDNFNNNNISTKIFKENIELSKNLLDSMDVLSKHNGDNDFIVQKIENAYNWRGVIKKDIQQEYITNKDLDKLLLILLYGNSTEENKDNKDNKENKGKQKPLDQRSFPFFISYILKFIAELTNEFKTCKDFYQNSIIKFLFINNAIIIHILGIVDKIMDKNYSFEYYENLINSEEAKQGIINDYEIKNFTNEDTLKKVKNIRATDQTTMNELFQKFVNDFNSNKDKIINKINQYSYNEKLSLSNEILNTFKLIIHGNFSIRFKYENSIKSHTEYNDIKNDNNGIFIKFLLNTLCDDLKKQNIHNDNFKKLIAINDKISINNIYYIYNQSNITMDNELLSLYKLYFQEDDCITKELLKYIKEKITHESMRYMDYNNYFNSLFIFIDEFLGENNNIKLTAKFKDLLDKAKANNYSTQDNNKLLHFKSTLDQAIDAITNSYKINKYQIKDKEINQILSFTFNLNAFIIKEKNMSQKALNLMNKKDMSINRKIQENIKGNINSNNLVNVKKRTVEILGTTIITGTIFVGYNSKNKNTNKVIIEDKNADNEEIQESEKI